MKKTIFTPKCVYNFTYLGVFLLSFIFTLPAFAHQSPNTIVLIDAHPKQLNIELQVPLSELGWAVNIKFDENSKNKIEENKSLIEQYFLSHLKIYNSTNKLCKIEFKDMILEQGEKDIKSIDLYQELKVFLIATPINHEDARNFTFDYTGIMHKVATHITYVYLRNDWQTGNFEQNNVLGIIRTEIEDNKIHPLVFNLEKGSTWKGFKGMILLGMRHIREGIDHLLFLWVLLLPALMIVENGRWKNAPSLSFSIKKIVKITFAFTVGHSITLIIGALGWYNPPVKPIEITIALSILITAIHAIKPLFPNKEIYVASGFGLIHGCAFATILSKLSLEPTALTVSLLGFNMGIELMQLIVVLIVMPFMLLLNKTKYARFIRIIGASSAIIISLAWAMERYFEKSNAITRLLETIFT